jgi:hypothetical protein
MPLTPLQRSKMTLFGYIGVEKNIFKKEVTVYSDLVIFLIALSEITYSFSVHRPITVPL